MGAVVLSVDAVSKTYVAADGARIAALDAVSLDVREGEFVSVIGPSGCGKSTLFQIIGGLPPATPATSESTASASTARIATSAWCSRRSPPFRGAASSTTWR